MARPHKQMPGRAYHVTYHEDRSSRVDCTYLCPYCMHDTVGSFEASADVADQLERGGFFQPLRCGICGKVVSGKFLGGWRPE